LKHLDLFSGIGGFALAARWVGWETVGFCEIDPYCQKVLRKHWPDVPIHEDIKTFDGQECDIISASWPCQPYSVAGKQKGAVDDRDLWPDTVRVLKRCQPTWFVGENVAGFIKVGLDSALSDLEDLGYSFRTFVIPAVAVGAPHRRDRVWIIAHAEWDEQPRQESRCRSIGRMGRKLKPISWNRPWEDAVAFFRRVDDGISGRMVTDRTDAIRNSICPQIAQVIFSAIEDIEFSQ
jgi:DNA (cytosine-5)-methyltransferase 1